MNMNMNHREYLIEDHTWAYNHNKKAINKYWKERHTFISNFTGENMVRSFIKAAKHHKHMIEQLKALPDIR